jgi:hypothetical protein
VQQHVHVAGKLTPGLGPPPGHATTFAATQAAWRFFNNDAITLPQLVEPLHHVVAQWRPRTDAWALVVHDWSVLSYPTHRRKTDRVRIGSRHSRGYDLTTLLLVDGHTGDPVAPLELSPRAARAVHSTRSPAPSAKANHLDEVRPAMREVARRGLGRRVVHVIDREADALAYYREWHADGHYFLVRADARRTVRWQGAEIDLSALNGRLQAQGRFHRRREVTYRGQKASQHAAEVAVVLDRPAWRQRTRGGRRVNERVAGEPITLRLVVARVCDERGVTVAVWYLLTNLPPEADTATVALWYYWRWRIESFFKLLKGAGQEVERWQQETAEAVARRLLVAAMACVLVWKLERATTAEAISFREWLVRLSGRQMKSGRRHTAPALLAGLHVYLAMLEVLEHHSLDELRAMRHHLDLTDPDTG